MEIISIPDTVNVKFTTTTTTPQKNLGFSKLPINRDSYSRVSCGLSPIDAVAPPIVRKNLCKTAPRTLIRKRRRTRRRSLTGGSDSDDGGDVGGENGFFGDDGPFGGSGSGGGRGWSFGSGGGSNWDDEDHEEDSLASADPAFDFVYEVISWIVLSNCVHFAFKKVVNWVNNDDSSSSREKLGVPLC